jgi:hypothetical protein
MKRKPDAPHKESDRVKYSDLPITLRKEIERAIEGRKRIGLFDDTVYRKERALRYHIWRSK